MTSDIKLLTVLLFLAFSAYAFGEPLDEDAARYAAASFFSGPSAKAKVRAKGRQLVLSSEGHEAGYYVFERPEGGVVFVADDDAIGRTVLGYTDAGGYDAEVLPDGLRDWLSQISLLMQAVHEGKIEKRGVRRKAGSVRVQPLIATRWNQGAPYNYLCPLSNGEQCVTGCVATAMAQVMKFWEWPKHGYGSKEYYDEGCGQPLMQDFSQSQYDWDDMHETYSSNTSSADGLAVATLMRDCGYAVEMRYTPTESAASISAEVLQQYFHYSHLAKDRYVNNYSEEMWHAFIQEDLLAGRPVLYNGQSLNGGHEFILDGFDTEGYYHVNWGWGGNKDGWFVLTNLNGYNSGQWMINHLEPDYTDETTFSYALSGDGTLTINGKGMMPQEYAFATAPWKDKYTSISKIVIGEGVTSIVNFFGNGATWWERFLNLEEVVLPEGLLYIGRNAFMAAEGLTSVEIPSTVVSMDYAFNGCSNLTSLRLPKGVMEYSDELTGLVDLSVDDENPWLCVENGVLYSKDLRSLIYAPEGLSTVVVSAQTEGLYDSDLFFRSAVFFQSKTAPSCLYKIYGTSAGTLYVPYESTGYSALKSQLPSGWKLVTYTDMNYFLDAKVKWSLEDGTLTLSGWGPLQNQEYASTNAPYYEQRGQIHKLVVHEGVDVLCADAFEFYRDLQEVELPASLREIGAFCFMSTAIKTLTCKAQQAPMLRGSYIFEYMPANGVLRVPEGANYSAWMTVLPTGWKIERFTPEKPVSAHSYAGEQAVKDLDEWEKLLTTAPNAIGIVDARNEYLAYMSRNLLVQDAEAGGYKCPYFRLTDLTYGYSSASKAPQTGLAVPVAFRVQRGEYNRRLYKGYNTVCLPFAVDESVLPEGSRMFGYSHFDSENNDAVFAAQPTTAPGNACFITCDEDAVWHLELDGVNIGTAQPSVTDGHVCGTFVTTDAYAGIGYNPRTFDNVFAPLQQNLHPFRACFIMAAPAAGKLGIRLMDEGMVDAVNSAVAPPVSGHGDMFTLDGKRVHVPRKGQAYVRNGKIWIR